MRTHLLFVAASVLVGCNGSGFSLRQQSCSVDVTRFSQDLTNHVIQGDGSGAFDYAPAGKRLATIAGSYDLQTGDYAWTETGSEESWVDAIEVSGFGYANENGDLDIIGTRSRTDVRGIVEETQFRTERVGCGVEHRVRFTASGEERERVERGTFEADAYVYSSTTGVDGFAYNIDGERLSDGTYTETVSYDSPDFERTAETVGNLLDDTFTFTYDDDFESSSVGSVSRVGTDVQFTNGTRDREFVLRYNDRVEEWSYRIDYNGDGEGEVTINGGTRCTLTYDDFQCRYNCSGNRGDC